MPKVSIIIPVYNVSGYLTRCIDSIVAQTFKDYEAIFVNDGSTDDSAELCLKLIAPYENMRMLNKQNGGLTSARLCGFQECRGEFVVFVDSDDYLHPNYLEILYEAINRNNADISLCSYFTDNGKERKERMIYLEVPGTVITKDNILSDYVLPQIPSINPVDSRLPSFLWMRMFRKSLISNDFFISERDVYQEDLASAVQIYSRCNTIAVVNKPLYYYCINPESLTLCYREGAWDMMLKLYGLLQRQLLNADNAFITNRYHGFVLNAILFALRNAAIKGHKSFKRAVRQIKADCNAYQLLDGVGSADLHGRYKVLYYCYRFNTINLLYCYYKMSQHD